LEIALVGVGPYHNVVDFREGHTFVMPIPITTSEGSGGFMVEHRKVGW